MMIASRVQRSDGGCATNFRVGQLREVRANGVLGSRCGLARGLQTASLHETSPPDYAAASKKLDCSGDRDFEATSRWRWALKGWVEPVAQPSTTTGNVVTAFALGKGGVRTVRSLTKRLTRVANQGK
jgi:hypothetical protein